MNDDLTKTLGERNASYGEFENNARISQMLKNTFYLCRKVGLSDVQKEAVDLICTKLSRILSGNPNHVDSWHDIAGYALLVEKDIEAKREAKENKCL